MTATSKQPELCHQILAALGVMAILLGGTAGGSFSIRGRSTEAVSAFQREPKAVVPICLGNGRQNKDPQFHTSRQNLSKVCTKEKGEANDTANDDNA